MSLGAQESCEIRLPLSGPALCILLHGSPPLFFRVLRLSRLSFHPQGRTLEGILSWSFPSLGSDYLSKSFVKSRCHHYKTSLAGLEFKARILEGQRKIYLNLTMTQQDLFELFVRVSFNRWQFIWRQWKGTLLLF